MSREIRGNFPEKAERRRRFRTKQEMKEVSGIFSVSLLVKPNQLIYNMKGNNEGLGSSIG